MNSSSSDIKERVLEYPASHLRVLGPPGSGKTRLLVDRYHALAKRSASRDRGKGLRNGGTFVLTYSTESHARLTDAVVPRECAHLGPIPVLTHSRLAEEIIIASLGAPPVIIKDLEERLLLDKVIDDRKAEFASDFRSICRSNRFRTDVLAACHFLLQNNIDEQALSALRRTTAMRPELDDVLLLYGGFREELEARGLSTYYDVSWVAVGCCEGSVPPHPVVGASVILVEDFQDIDPGQFELLKMIAPPGTGPALNVFGDPLGSLFARRGTQHRYLMEEFPRLYGGETFRLDSAGVQHTAIGGTMEAIIQEVLGRDAADFIGPRSHDDTRVPPPRTAAPSRHVEPDGPDLEDFSIETVRDEVDEAYVVAARIQQLLSSEKYTPDDIAIVTNEKRRYEPILEGAAIQRGIPFDSGRSKQGAFEDFVCAFLSLFDTPGEPIALRSIFTSPLYPYLRKAVPGPWTEAADNRDQSVENLRSFVDTLIEDARSRDTEQWMRVLADKCLFPVCASYHSDTGDDSMFTGLCRLLESWCTYADALERLGGRPSVRVFTRVSGLFAKSSSAPRTASGSVGFYSCREAKGLFFPVVFVVGCSELLFPSAGRRESVVPSAQLQGALEEVFPDRPANVYAARSQASQLAEEYHLLYLGLTRATDILHITAPERFAGQDLPAPASILKKTIPEPFQRSTPLDAKTPPQVRFAKAWVGGAVSRKIEKRLVSLSPAGALWRTGPPDAAPVAIAPFRLSKSSIETFLKCPRRFFYRKILRIPEEEGAPARVGLLLHTVMAVLGERYPTKRQLQSEATGDVVRSVIDSVIREEESIDALSFYNRSLQHHLNGMVGKILHLDAEETGGYTITAIEKSLPFSYGGWAFSGRIDRVEETATKERIIVDFKTGKFDKTGKTLRRKTLAALNSPEEANWQVPLYVWGFKDTEGAAPRAFKHVVTSPGDEPFTITLFVCPDDENVFPEAESNKRCSYITEIELEEIMKKATSVASSVFEPRTHFEKAPNNKPCRMCEWRRLCEREHA